jgi:glycerophosphoryl diester phosphodiesterase
MRQFLLRLLLLSLVVLVIFGVYRLLTIRPLANVAFFQDLPLLTAVDSAAPVDAPPYSLAAFEAARRAGANSLYLPVVLTRDGVLVVAGAPVDQLTLAELESRGPTERVVTLHDALAAYPDLRAVVVVRQPSLQGLAALLQAIDANGARPRVLAVVDHPLLAGTLREQAPDLATATTTAEANAFLTTKRLRLTPFYRPAAPAMLLEGSQINKRLVDAARSRGIHLLALPDQQSTAAPQTLIDAGVDGVILTDPALIAGLSWPGQAP